MNYSEESLDLLRDKMVKEQLARRDIKDRSVLEVFKKVPRHRFIEPSKLEFAYSDTPLSIDKGQTISQPYIVALMTQALGLDKKDKVLEIGTGSGYQTAILAESSKTVYTIDRFEALTDRASDILSKLGYKNIYFKTGDGSLGWQEEAPFNKIILTAASPKVPEPLLEQLALGGILAAPIGSRLSQEMIVLKKSENGNISKEVLCGCSFVPLVGKHGWSIDDTA
ncbi:MAG: protein-L-isoaspartate(D-aspartate) O-methyltransferase [Candidatus Omnitrophota bacterium]